MTNEELIADLKLEIEQLKTRNLTLSAKLDEAWNKLDVYITQLEDYRATIKRIRKEVEDI